MTKPTPTSPFPPKAEQLLILNGAILKGRRPPERPPLPRENLLRQNLRNDPTMNVGQSEVAAAIAVGELLMIDAQQM